MAKVPFVPAKRERTEFWVYPWAIIATTAAVLAYIGDTISRPFRTFLARIRGKPR
ncbi:MAG: hypothetical protein JWN49_50 [Parcubacteria group bacterium]|nr:hypothetical protein [Parcubacteria group bacterium]